MLNRRRAHEPVQQTAPDETQIFIENVKKMADVNIKEINDLHAKNKDLERNLRNLRNQQGPRAQRTQANIVANNAKIQEITQQMTGHFNIINMVKSASDDNKPTALTLTSDDLIEGTKGKDFFEGLMGSIFTGNEPTKTKQNSHRVITLAYKAAFLLAYAFSTMSDPLKHYPGLKSLIDVMKKHLDNKFDSAGGSKIKRHQEDHHFLQRPRPQSLQ